MVLSPLVAKDDLKAIRGIGKSAFRHIDHRWTLPLVHHAQDQGTLPRPCNLVLFDMHHDALPSRNPDALNDLLRGPITTEALIAACDSVLSSADDDWITVGMEVGVFGHAVVFGVDDPGEAEPFACYKDRHQVVHELFFPELPGNGLRYQGSLSDSFRSTELRPLWDALGWHVGRPGETGLQSGPPIALDFDLDCFTMQWRDYTLPWTDEVWATEFERVSDYSTTRGMSGRTFVDALVKRAGLVTFATEPDCCGGAEKSDKIWEALNKNLFDGRLSVNAV